MINLRFLLLVSLSPCLLVCLSAHAQDKELPFVVYEGKDGPGKGKHIVLVSGDEEYRSEEALPQLGKILAKHHGFKCTVLFAIDPKTGEINPNVNNNIPGLEILKTADLMIIATRFRNLPEEQMQHIADYIDTGKPIIGLRTATHAFANMKGKFAKYNNGSGVKGYEGGFGRQVLGDYWFNHHGGHGSQSTRGIIAKDADKHPILKGIKDGDIWGPTDVYGVRLPLPAGCEPLVMGQVLVGMKSTDKPIESTKERIAHFEKGVKDLQSSVSAREKSIFDDLKETVKKLPDKKSAEYAKLLAGHPQGKDLQRLKTALEAEKRSLTDAKKNAPMMPLAWTRVLESDARRPTRVFTTTLGASEDFVADGSRRLVVNAAYWCLGLEERIAAVSNVEIIGEYKASPFKGGGFKKGVRPSQLSMNAAQEKEKPDKRDEQAKEVAEQFMKAMKAEDIDAVMKVVDVPFFWDGAKNINDVNTLKAGFAGIFEEKDLTQIEYKLKATRTFGNDYPNKKDLRLLKEVIEESDRIVVFAVSRDGIAVFVRIREGKAKVVGFRD